MKKIFVIDFDDTITKSDVASKILEEFGVGDWKVWDEMLDREEITIEKAVVEQFKAIRGDLDKIIEFALKIKVRDGFTNFLRKINDSEHEVLCLSAGINFIIDAFIDKYDWEIRYEAPHSELTSDGIIVTLPEFDRSEYSDFKEYRVRTLKNQGYTVIYFGDGMSDIRGVIFADYRYAVRGSSLSNYCKRNQLPFTEFNSFNEINQI